eukprot:4608995-Pyramimonas_sp.AAC.1
MRYASGNSWQCVCRHGRVERRFANGHIAIERAFISTAYSMHRQFQDVFTAGAGASSALRSGISDASGAISASPFATSL